MKHRFANLRLFSLMPSYIHVFVLIRVFIQGLIAIRAQGNAIKTLLMQVVVFQKENCYDV